MKLGVVLSTLTDLSWLSMLAVYDDTSAVALICRGQCWSAIQTSSNRLLLSLVLQQGIESGMP